MIENEKLKMPFLHHINELRKKILISICFFLITFILSYFTSPFFIEIIRESASRHEIDLNIFNITDSVTIYIKTMFFQSICVFIPFLFYQLYLFIKPALEKRIKKVIAFTMPVVSALFIIGAILGLKVFVPLFITFFLNTSSVLSANPVYGFSEFFTFVYTICFLIGLILELPVLIIFLNVTKVVTPEFLARARRYVYPILSFLAVVSTPPDFISALIIMFILFALYEISLIICKKINKKEVFPNA